MGNAMRIPTHTANANKTQIRQHFAPAIPGVFDPAEHHKRRGASATEKIVERESRRRRSSDVWCDALEGDNSTRGGDLHVSEEYQECAICFEPLCKERTAVYADEEGVRTCPHFFHERCARAVVEASTCASTCPICPVSCRRAIGVPFPSEDADEWFRLCDVESQGAMGRDRVLSVIRAQLPVDWRRLEKDLPMIWPKFAGGYEGVVTKEALVGKGGLLEYVSQRYPARLRKYERVPHVTDKREWFRYWDEDGSGCLEKDEVVRALIKSFNIKDDVAHIQDVRSVVENIWCVFDLDDSGGIDLTEFMITDGLGDSIMAAFAVAKRAEIAARKNGVMRAV